MKSAAGSYGVNLGNAASLPGKCAPTLRGFPILTGRGETNTQFKVSKLNSILDLIDTYRILWKAVFNESRINIDIGVSEPFITFHSNSHRHYALEK
ncbi:hypothetical protein ACS0TY_028364 [Phlomoides rotata]